MSWDEWIARQESDPEKNLHKGTFDVLLEMCVSSYDLDKKSRKAGLKDKVQYFILWWNKHKSKMKYYKSTVKLASLLKVDHSTIVHYTHRRKPTIFYSENTRCIDDFLNS